MRALPTAILHTLGRAVLISIGITMAGEKDPQKVGRSAIGAAVAIEVAIEVFALAWAGYQQRRR